jgi:hypothetical protein
MKLLELFDTVDNSKFQDSGMGHTSEFVDGSDVYTVVIGENKHSLARLVFDYMNFSAKERKDTYFISFFANFSDSLTGNNRPIKIFSKVAASIKNFVENHPTKTIVYGYNLNESERAALYKKFIKYFESFGYSLKEEKSFFISEFGYKVHCFKLQK